MAGNMSRIKGARGELEVIRLLQPIVDRACDHCGHIRLVLKKNRDQRYAPKQYDVDGLPWIALEVKRVENQSAIGSWWKQTLAATREGQIPVLLYRQNNRAWMVRMRVPIKVSKKVAVRATVTTDFDGFLKWFEQKIIAELE